MFLNTKQVRTLAKQVSNVIAQYTDKTLADKTSKRRSVIFCFRHATDADALANYLRSNTQNKVTRTGVESNYATRTHGGQYVRVIANIA